MKALSHFWPDLNGGSGETANTGSKSFGDTTFGQIWNSGGGDFFFDVLGGIIDNKDFSQVSIPNWGDQQNQGQQPQNNDKGNDDDKDDKTIIYVALGGMAFLVMVVVIVMALKK